MSTQAARSKLVGAVAAVVLLIIATSPLTTAVLIRWQASQIVNDSLPGVTSSGLANLNISEGFLETALAMSTPSADERHQMQDRIAEQARETDKLLAGYQDSIQDSGDRDNYQRLLDDRARFRSTRQQVFDLMDQGRTDEAVRLFNGRGLLEYQKYQASLNKIVRYNIDEAGSRGSQILWLADLIIALQAVLLVFFVIYAFFVPWVTLLERLTRRHTVDDV